MTDAQVQSLRELVEPILRKYGVVKAKLFGSFARGDMRSDSDLDLLVEFGKKIPSMWDFVRMRQELADHVGREVDVVTDKSVVAPLRSYIYRDLITLYD